MAGTGVGKFSSTAGSNTANMTVNFAENMAPSNVNNAARELMGHMRDMYEQLGDGYFEFGDGDGTYTVARGDADTITITSSADISGIYFAGRKIRITDGGANVVEGTIASSSHSSTTQTVNLTGISLASGTPTKVELGIDTAAFGGRVILDDDGDTYIEAPTDDTIDIYVAGAKDFVITANTFTAESGSTIAAQALTATTLTTTGAIAIANDGNIGSAGDADAIAISSSGVVTFSQAPVFPDGSIAVADLDIDGATDIGAAIVDADLFIIDDGAGGTNRKVTASRLKTYAGATSSFTEAVTITTADNTTQLTLISTDADDSGGPKMNLYRNSSSPADADSLGRITFTGRNDNSQDVVIAEWEAIMTDVSDGTEDGQTIFRNMFAGNPKPYMDFSSAGTVFNNDSLDLDLRVESNSYAHCLFVDGGNDRVGVGEDSDIGGLFRVSLGDSGVTGVDAGGQGIVIEDNASGGLTIATPNDAEGGTKFADPQDNDVGRINYDHSADAMFFMTSGNEQLRITADGKIGFKESSPEGSDGSLTLNQAGGDTQIISMKSSDVAHSITSVAEADTYAFMKKESGATGGLQIVGMNDSGNVAMQILGISNSGEDTGKGTGDHGCVRIDAASRSGTSLGTQGSNVNMVTICNNNTVRFIFDAEGDFHADSSSTTFDTYEDAQLVRAYDLSHGKGVIASKFDKFVQYNASDLTDAGLVGKVNNEYN